MTDHHNRMTNLFDAKLLVPFIVSHSIFFPVSLFLQPILRLNVDS